MGVTALGELPMVIHDKEVSALVEELPVNSEDEVLALGELPMVIHDKEERDSGRGAASEL